MTIKNQYPISHLNNFANNFNNNLAKISCGKNFGKNIVIASAITASLLLSACGQKGALYLPESDGAAVVNNGTNSNGEAGIPADKQADNQVQLDEIISPQQLEKILADKNDY